MHVLALVGTVLIVRPSSAEEALQHEWFVTALR